MIESKLHNSYQLFDQSDYFLVPTNFQNANATCLLCLEMDCNPVAHLKTRRHQNLYEKFENQAYLHLPDDSFRMTILSSYLNHIYFKQMIYERRLEKRFDTLAFFEDIIHTIDANASVRFIGFKHTGLTSYNTDMTMEVFYKQKDSNQANIVSKTVNQDTKINIDKQKQTCAQVIFKLREQILDKEKYFSENYAYNYSNYPYQVKSNIQELKLREPRLRLSHQYYDSISEEQVDENIEIVCRAKKRYCLYQLIEKYLTADPRVGPMILLVRYWSNICKIDDPDSGTLYPSAIIILVLYFLQQIEPPIIPLLNRTLSNSNSKPSSKKSKNRGLFNPSPNANDSYSEGSDEESDLGIDAMELEFDDIDNVKFLSKNQSSVTQLFLQFFHCMSNIFNNQEPFYLSIRNLSQSEMDQELRHFKKFVIEDPITKNNLANRMSRVRTKSYIQECFKRAFIFYCSLPCDMLNKAKTCDLFDRAYAPTIYIESEKYSVFRKLKAMFLSKSRRVSFGADIDKNIQELVVLTATDIDLSVEIISKASKENFQYIISNIVAMYNTDLLIPEDSDATTFCNLCKRYGHSSVDCEISIVKKLEHINQEYEYNLNQSASFSTAFQKILDEDVIIDDLHDQHQLVLDRLQDQININSNLDCKLELYGSVVNGLGSFDSDLDICMTISGNETGNGLSFKNCLEEARRALDRSPNVDKRSLEPILTARVPIIRFKYHYNNHDFDIDLSMYNKCALYNSKLVKAYCELDERFPLLFKLVKKIVKNCCIGDASRGSLSSYAWSLLCIHFLQHTDPPILPVLQELPKNQDYPEILINGCNVWFYGLTEDIDHRLLESHNDSNLMHLLKQFFIYYSNFDFDMNVVSVRKFDMIDRFEKDWMDSIMCIEDPFELHYNLARRLDNEMAFYIRNTFAYLYKNTCKVQDQFLREIRVYNVDQHESKLVKTILNPTQPPWKSPPLIGCKYCHRVGHGIALCPEKQFGGNRFAIGKWHNNNSINARANTTNQGRRSKQQH